MYDIQAMLGKVVTIKTLTGEILGQLISTDDDVKYVTVTRPLNVVVNNGEVVLVPLVLTADANMVTIPIQNILFITPALESASEDYLSILDVEEDEVEVEVEVEEDGTEAETGIVSE
jgi:hypothetical protein|tara:strand:- start:318 stop:668 length:351 start_codon:yes stop_codon:yes gene_type:complete